MRLEDIGELFGDSVEPLSLDNNVIGVAKHEGLGRAEKAQQVERVERVS